MYQSTNKHAGLGNLWVLLKFPISVVVTMHLLQIKLHFPWMKEWNRIWSHRIWRLPKQKLYRTWSEWVSFSTNTTRHATGRIELRTFVSRNVPNVPKCPEMSQNISSLALVCVHMHTRAHVASLNSGQYKVWFFLRKSLFVPKLLCSHWELELDLW